VYWQPTLFATFPFTSPPVRHRVPSHFNWILPPGLTCICVILLFTTCLALHCVSSLTLYFLLLSVSVFRNTIFRELNSNYSSFTSSLKMVIINTERLSSNRDCRNTMQCTIVGKEKDTLEHGARYVRHYNCICVFSVDLRKKKAAVISLHSFN